MSQKANKQLRKELMANQSQQNNVSTLISHEKIHGEIHSGPIPDPETLERYKNADPSFPERIMKMAEAHNQADVKTKYRISWGNLIIPMMGQIFTVVLATLGTFACIYLALKGFSGAAIASITGAYSPIIINAFRSIRRK